MGKRLEGKVAIVTGAGSSGPGWGNGKAVAVLFAREGARVFAVDREPVALEETRAIIAGEGFVCEAFTADVTRSDQVEALARRCSEEFGRIDILHNNVGILALGPYIAYSTTKGAILAFTRSVALQYAAKGIRANTILPGLIDTPMVTATGLPGAYALGDAARMRAIRAAQCPMGRMGDSWEVARAALFLASDEASYITGAELVVDGGLTCKIA